METINFYSTNDEYGFMSNFAGYPFKLDGKVWPTTEHFFQASKFKGTPHYEEVRKINSPMIAARTGRKRSLPLRKDWNSVKDDVMRRAVLAKFEQHDDIRQQLLATQDVKLVEHTANDSYWGDGGDGHGKNMLGQILMEVRAELGNRES